MNMANLLRPAVRLASDRIQSNAPEVGPSEGEREREICINSCGPPSRRLGPFELRPPPVSCSPPPPSAGSLKWPERERDDKPETCRILFYLLPGALERQGRDSCPPEHFHIYLSCITSHTAGTTLHYFHLVDHSDQFNF